MNQILSLNQLIKRFPLLEKYYPNGTAYSIYMRGDFYRIFIKSLPQEGLEYPQTTRAVFDFWVKHLPQDEEFWWIGPEREDEYLRAQGLRRFLRDLKKNERLGRIIWGMWPIKTARSQKVKKENTIQIPPLGTLNRTWKKAAFEFLINQGLWYEQAWFFPDSGWLILWYEKEFLYAIQADPERMLEIKELLETYETTLKCTGLEKIKQSPDLKTV